MVLSVTMRYILLLCVTFSAFQPYKVCSLGSTDLALRGNKRLLWISQSRILTADGEDVFHTRHNLAPAPSVMFDPIPFDKRTVGKGSDPIHNRC